MKRYLYKIHTPSSPLGGIRGGLLLLLFVLTAIMARGQGFNPDSPAEPSSRYRLSVAAQPQDAATVTGGGLYAVNTNVTVKATATDTKWQFTGWTDSEGTVVSTSLSYSFRTTNKNETLTAHFEEVRTSTLTVAYDPASLKASTSTVYKEGTTVTLTAGGYNYYVFQNWTDKDGVVVSDVAKFNYVTTGEDQTLTAHYRFDPSAPAEPSSTKPKHKVYFTADPSGTCSFNQSNGFQVAEGSTFSVKATPATGYVFQNWTQNDVVVGTNATYSGTMGTEDVTLVAHFAFNPGGPGEPSADTREHYSLYLPTLEMYRGETTLLPVSLENTGDVKTLSFTILLPEGVTADASALQTTLRTSAYTPTATLDGQTLTVSLTGGTQISDRNGVVVRIPLLVDSSAQIADGEYGISLTNCSVTTDNGQQTTVTARNGRLVISTLEEGDLQASFSVDRYMNRAQFTNTSTESARSFVWDFGDGTTSTEVSPMHIYATPGTYTVHLTAKAIVKSSEAEQTIVINPASTWIADGDFTLDADGTGARNFTSLEEAFTLLAQCQTFGNIGISVVGSETYACQLTTAEGQQTTVNGPLSALVNQLEDNNLTIHYSSEAIEGGTLNFISRANDLTLIGRLLAHITTDNVAVKVNGVLLNPAALTTHTAQTVCAGVATQEESLSNVSDSDRVQVSWVVSVSPNCHLSGYATNGNGDLPAMTVGGTAQHTAVETLSYHITVSLDGATLYTYIYNVSVKPLLANRTFTTSGPADGSTVRAASKTLSWSNIADPQQGYTLYLKRTLDNVVTTDTLELTATSYSFFAAAGATYSWKVTAYGECDAVTSAEKTFSVEKYADLTVVALDGVPEATTSGSALTLTATIRNIGKAVTAVTNWTDALYYSTAPDDFAHAVRLAYTNHSGALESFDNGQQTTDNGQQTVGQYQVTWNITVPMTDAANLYFYVMTDSGNSETEASETNNTIASAAVEMVTAYVDEDDYAALCLLYNALNGEVWTKPWKINNSAITTTAWPGVTFNTEGRVTAISLPNNNLAGTLPTEGFSLPYLETLNLSSNDIKGDLAAFCEALVGGRNENENGILKTLNLSYCNLTGLTGVLPASITSLNLGYQQNVYPLSAFTLQEWTMGSSEAEVALGSLIAYNHAAQDFSAHPKLQLRTADTNTYVGHMVWNGEYYAFSLSGDYKMASGTEYLVQPTEGPAAYCKLRATLDWIPGDANVDASVDVLDAQHTLNYILARQSGSFNFLAADTYTSNTINVQDVVATINMFIEEAPSLTHGLSPSELPAELRHPSPAREGEDTPAGCLFSAEDGLWLSTTEPVAALDFTLEGVSGSQVSLMLNRKRFQMTTHDTGTGVRIVIISTAGDEIAAGDTRLLRLGAEAEVTRVVAADIDAQPVMIACGQQTEGLTPSPSLIEMGDRSVFDLTGRRVKAGTTGVSIQNGKKVIK